MAHELRHAYQQEHGLADLDSYIDSEEDFDTYINQPCEVDAREYQAGFFTEEMYDEFFKFLK